MLGEMLCSMPVLGALGNEPWQGAPVLGTGGSGPARPQMCPNAVPAARVHGQWAESWGQCGPLQSLPKVLFFSSFWQKSLFFFNIKSILM